MQAKEQRHLEDAFAVTSKRLSTRKASTEYEVPLVRSCDGCLERWKCLYTMVLLRR
jgi:hypothetical protein